MAEDEPRLRQATPADIPTLEELIAASARGLSRGFYTDREIEAAVAHVFGVDTELVADGTYLLIESEGRIVACGGWSRRRTLFGGDLCAAREDGWLDPAKDAARIRAFFVSPDQARRGYASTLLKACEDAAAAACFARMALVATLPGVPFYAARGYRPAETMSFSCGDVRLRLVPMERHLLQEGRIYSV